MLKKISKSKIKIKEKDEDQEEMIEKEKDNEKNNKIKTKDKNNLKELISQTNNKKTKNTLYNKDLKEKKKTTKKEKLTKMEYKEETSEEEPFERDENKKISKIKLSKKDLKSKNHKKIYHKNEHFEKDIMEIYKKLSLANESKKNINLKYCEKKLRSVLNNCQNDPDLIINRNIIDKLNRITLHNKMNLNYIIGDIYISLMNKESLFDYDNKNFEINDLLLFINKVIQFKDIIKATRIGFIYNNCLMKFLFNITKQFKLDEEQLNCIKLILEKNKEIEHTLIFIKSSKGSKISKVSFFDFIFTLSLDLRKQPNIYEQYKIFIQNKVEIIQMIENSNLEDKDLYNNYLSLGEFLVFLFYNKSFTLYLEDNKNENDGIRKLLYDGYENNEEINIINEKKYYIEDDNNIKELKEQLCVIILKYVEKYIKIVEYYSIQYLIFILVKRVYFCHYKKYQKKELPLLIESLVNMCFFDNSPMKLISTFINKILKSTKKEDLKFKDLLIKSLNKVRYKKNFLYRFPKSFKIKNKEEDEEKEEEEEEEDDDENDENKIDKGLSIINNEIMLTLHYDLTIGFFNYKIIKAGEKFIFYEELNQDFCILDFCLILDELDIKIIITDLTENRDIFFKERLNGIFETPLKMILFFTSPRILKFEFDNSYSWIRSKTIKYKTNIFYPKNPFSISHELLKNKYKKSIFEKNKKNNKKDNKEENNLLILNIDGQNKALNLINVKNNLDAINKMIKDKYLSIFSIYIKIKNNEKKNNLENIDNNEDKSYFYYYKDNEGLIENELKKEIFEKYLYDLLSNSNENLNIINLYIINGDINPNNNNIDYDDYSFKKLLCFEPSIKINGNLPKIIFFIQNLSHSQILYYLYEKAFRQKLNNIIILINYTKYGGYQIILYKNEDIISNLKDFKGLNKSTSLDENMRIISDEIKKLYGNNQKNVDIVLTASIDNKEKEIIPEKIEEKIIENIGNNEKDKKNIKIIKTDIQFNNDVQINSHVFYLDN